jgi:hypothetical protein
VVAGDGAQLAFDDLLPRVVVLDGRRVFDTGAP